MFDAHAKDDAASGTYVLGATAHYTGTERPAGFGIRAAVFVATDARNLARVALHEAAHLVGADEAGAREVERACIVP